MTTSPESPHHRRSLFFNTILQGLRTVLSHTNTFIGALGVFLVAGLVVAGIFLWLFGELAEHVQAGTTQAFDTAVLLWIAAHRSGTMDTAMLELTALGTGTVVLMIVAVSGLFLALTKHQYSALLLGVSTAGGLLLDLVLKTTFARPRPHIVAWGTNAVSSSFPSGHAMSAAVVYGTVAYLAARLQKRMWSRILTMIAALLVIILICISRLYLGVHYPSDVLGGVIIGLAWAGFCMATLEAIQKFGKRGSHNIPAHERPAPEIEPD